MLSPRPQYDGSSQHRVAEGAAAGVRVEPEQARLLGLRARP